MGRHDETVKNFLSFFRIITIYNYRNGKFLNVKISHFIAHRSSLFSIDSNKECNSNETNGT